MVWWQYMRHVGPSVPPLFHNKTHRLLLRWDVRFVCSIIQVSLRIACQQIKDIHPSSRFLSELPPPWSHLKKLKKVFYCFRKGRSQSPLTIRLSVAITFVEVFMPFLIRACLCVSSDEFVVQVSCATDRRHEESNDSPCCMCEDATHTQTWKLVV